jgi:sucrose-6-phosphate hydrolase SacC (GH32 family)
MMHLWRMPAVVLLVALACGAWAADREDVLLADFEGKDYGAWKATGEAFGTGPARGTLPDQMPVSGFLGEGLVNSYLRGDDTEGTLTSPEFTVRRKRINFLVGGGRHPGKACVNLLVEGKVVRNATGRNSEHLHWHSWDVAEFEGKKAVIEIVDKQKGGWGHILVDQIVQSDRAPDPGDERKDLLAKAEASVAAAAKKVKDDPDRPIYHLLPPANWSNDPNGPLFYKGWYHLFYQHNPYGDDWGHMHWGHWRSKDLAHWEHQPIALWPSLSQDEDHVFSGCATVNPKGQLMLFYTSIGPRLPEQWAAIPEDDDLIKWKKHPANPLLTEKLHGDVKVHEWRDPFVFRAGGKTCMVLGGNLNANKGGQAVVNVYEAENDDLTKWKYPGVLFQHPDKGVANIECPLFFPLGGKWVLVVSQGKPVQWFVGSLDEKTLRFTAETRGAADYGDYYAPNCLEDAKGRRVLWGWVQGFRGGRGWNGCMTLPRVLVVSDPPGRLMQSPAPELEKLRGKALPLSEDLALKDAGRVIEGVRGDTLEIRAVFKPGDAKAFGLRVRRSDDGKNAVTIRCDGKQLDVAGTKVPLKAADASEWRVFLDHSVLEVYAGGECVTRVLYPGKNHLGVEAFAEGGTATLRRLEAWPMRSIWVKGDR